MIKANQIQKNIQPRQVTLYRNVFYSRVSTTVVLLLCISFLLQPIERAYASEVAQTEATSNEIINLAVDAGLSKETPTIEDVGGDVNAAVDTETKTLPAEVPDATEATTTTATTTTDVASTATTSDDVVAEDEGAISTTTEFTDEEIAALINPEDELPETDLGTTTATTTEISVPVTTVHSDAVMQFNRNDCVTVEDGSFYCQTKKEEVEQGTDGMYALQDKDGDLEIFLQKNGELTQLTFNQIDDAGPNFDSKSNSIVWHRLVNERYQIIAYDLSTKEEVQLTADSVNNMEPSRSGQYTVWQRWNGDNWDVVLYDGRETKFITDSPLHDIAPNVKGDLVMWNRLNTDNTQTIELYDIVTSEYTTITDDEGGALSNPRMVLVYETEFANGDVVTKGYDVETGEITPLANDPAELPDELPEPDATGETRALLQPKNPTKEDTEITDGLFPGIDGDGLGSATSTATSTPQVATGDLNLSSSTLAIAGSTPNASTSQSVLEMTLDLTPEVALNPDTSLDLVITPFVPTMESSLEVVE